MTSGAGLALHLHFMVMRVPVSFGMILGLSTKDGAYPSSSPPVRRNRKGKNGRRRRVRAPRGLTLKVQGNVGVAFSETVESVTPIISSVFFCGIGYFQGEKVSVFSGRLSRHFDSIRVGDRFGSLIPRDIGNRIRLEDAFHNERVSVLSDRGFFRKSRGFTVRNPVWEKRLPLEIRQEKKNKSCG